jgi:hypothetical protein
VTEPESDTRHRALDEDAPTFASRHRITLAAAEEIIALFGDSLRKCNNAVRRLKAGRKYTGKVARPPADQAAPIGVEPDPKP